MLKRVTVTITAVVAVAAVLGGARPATGQVPAATPAAAYAADIAGSAPSSASELRDLVERYALDRAGLQRRYAVEWSPDRMARLAEFQATWLKRIEDVEFDKLGVEGRIDHILMRSRLKYEQALLARQKKTWDDAAALMPFAGTILSLHDARRRMETIDPSAAATTLARLVADIEKAQKALDVSAESRTGGPKAPAPPRPSRIVAFRASEILDELKRVLGDWHRFYNGYDPTFSWWTAAPFKKADAALGAYGKAVRSKLVGIKEGEDEPIVGLPIGRDALQADLGTEFIPYDVNALLAIAEREFAWCDAEMLKAARDLGFGDDWRAALEKVKTLHVEPGRQADLVRDLAREAEQWVESRNLLTVPALAKEIWRIEMMSPERQKVNPFFLGGETIQVSFPTDTMSHEDKLMSMRGNNIHFARATVHHELIPGHHLQGFMTARYNSHRRAFSTPFWGEGWALYWEMLLWDDGFPKTPENRIGMLFWRMHRCARIRFSLGFHLGTLTPQQCVDLLVDEVGHERASAEGEVRRSFQGGYSPLYQCAYMLGGLQLLALQRELVGSGRMNERDFHDAVLRQGSIPIELLRAGLDPGLPLPRDARAEWLFYEPLRR